MENRSKSANNEENNWSQHFYIKLSIWVLGKADTKMEFEVKDTGKREQGKAKKVFRLRCRLTPVKAEREGMRTRDGYLQTGRVLRKSEPAWRSALIDHRRDHYWADMARPCFSHGSYSLTGSKCGKSVASAPIWRQIRSAIAGTVSHLYS